MKWKKNALRHSFCSYRLSATNDGAKTALIALHPNHFPAWAAKASESGKTEQEFVQSIIDAHGEVFRASLIEAEKAKYEEIVTLAASLPEDKKQEFVAYVQSLAGPATVSQ